MTDDEVHVEWETEEKLEPLDNGVPGIRLRGLRDVEGTFSGSLDYAAAVLGGLMSEEGDPKPTTLYIWGPDPSTRWWRHWFYRLRERITGERYPTICLASGPVTMKLEKEEEDGNEVVISGTFTKTGMWTFHDKEVNRP